MKVTKQDVVQQEKVVQELQYAADSLLTAIQRYKEVTHSKEAPTTLADAEWSVQLQLTRENARLITLRAQEKVAPRQT